jgi:NAD(P)-dependent dehydrogenase (short-subunit alcohol dehydrogenase family)
MATIVANGGSVEGAHAVARRTAEDFGFLDAAIPSMGGWWQGGPFLSVDAATRDAVMVEMLGAHFAFARTIIPEFLRRPGGRYIRIGGGAALEPIRNASLVSIAAAAQMMMTRALALELAGAAVDIMELVVDGPIRTRASEAFARPGWISADDVGRVVSACRRSFNALHRSGSGRLITRSRRKRKLRGNIA